MLDLDSMAKAQRVVALKKFLDDSEHNFLKGYFRRVTTRSGWETYPLL